MFRLVVPLAVLLQGALHLYLYRRVRVAFGGKGPIWLKLLFIGLAFLLPLGLLGFIGWLPVLGGLFRTLGLNWVGILFLVGVCFGLSDLFERLAWRLNRHRVAFKKTPKAAEPSPPKATPDPSASRDPSGGSELIDPSRRLFFKKAGLVAAGGSSTLLVGSAYWSAARPPEVRTISVTLSRLPKALSGLKIVQLTDVHIDHSTEVAWIQEVVKRVNARKPDLVVITGDLVDGQVPWLLDKVRLLAGMKSRYGSFFVTGNHEYYSGVGPWVKALNQMGIRVLRNERVAIGDVGASFDLAGVDDFRARGHAPGHGSDIRPIIAGRDPDRELVLLAHQPKSIGLADESKAGLQLSGHTHGGQIWPFHVLVGLDQPYLAGLYAHSADTQIYVSRGTGFWGPPMRLFAPAEISEIVLI